MPVILQINYTPGAEQLRIGTPESRLASAENINQLPGFQWKIWLRSADPLRRGGIYLFDTLEQARQWGDSARARLAAAGGSDVEARYFDIDEAPSRVNHAPLRSA